MKKFGRVLVTGEWTDKEGVATDTNALNAFTAHRHCEPRGRGNLALWVILSPSLTVTLSPFASLRINSAKNLTEILRALPSG